MFLHLPNYYCALLEVLMKFDYSALRLMSAAYHSISSQPECYYLISSGFRLCGWEDYRYGYIDNNGNHFHVNADCFSTLLLCNSWINVLLPAIGHNIRLVLSNFEALGVIHKCAYGSLGNSEITVTDFSNRDVNNLSWGITGRCNLKCKHCFLSAPNAKFGELPTEECLHMIDDFAACGVTRLSITGGEPLVRSDLFELIDYMREKGITLFGISTNGFLVNKKLLDELDTRELKPQFSISYDGTNGWHDWLRGIDGSESRVLDAIQLLSSRGFRTGSAMTVHKKNMNEIVPSIQKLHSVGCDGFKTNKVLNLGEWISHGSDCALSYQELFEKYLEALEELYCLYPNGMPMRIVLSRFVRIEKGEVDYKLIPIVTRCTNFDKTRACEATYRKFHISSDGRIQPCLALSTIDDQHNTLPYVNQIGLAASMNHPDFLKLTGASVQTVFDYNPECKKCEFASYCLGGCRAIGCADSPNNYFSKCQSSCLFFTGHYAEKVTSLLSGCCAKARCLSPTCS